MYYRVGPSISDLLCKPTKQMSTEFPHFIFDTPLVAWPRIPQAFPFLLILSSALKLTCVASGLTLLPVYAAQVAGFSQLVEHDLRFAFIDINLSFKTTDWGPSNKVVQVSRRWFHFLENNGRLVL